MQNIRLATPQDSEAILNIYAPFILDGAVTFEVEVPSVSDFAARVEKVLQKYPYLVYVVDSTVVAYAYASPHRERAAYCYSVETSVYISPQHYGQGIAKKLYDRLFFMLKELGYYNAYAGYTVPNEKSRIFHEKYGFSYVGTYKKVGYKLGEWRDVVWLEKAIQPHENLKISHS